MQKTVSIIVSEEVQGVFYRQSTKEIATMLDVKGQVRNLRDETVEIIATGEEEQIEKLVKWCWEGPPKAKVKNVVVKDLELKSFDKFIVVR